MLSRKSILMIQPGAFGDIIVCAPIAKWYYDAGFDIYWPTVAKFQNLVNELPYVNHVLLDDEEVWDADWLRSDVIKCLQMVDRYDFVLNLADRGPHLTAELPDEKSEQCKYRVAQVPFEQKYMLDWDTNTEKAYALFNDRLKNNTTGRYALCALETSNGKVELPVEVQLKYDPSELIHMVALPGYTIFDWYRLVINADAIYATETSWQCFIDGIRNDVVCPKYLLPRTPGVQWTVSEDWDMRYAS